MQDLIDQISKIAASITNLKMIADGKIEIRKVEPSGSTEAFYGGDQVDMDHLKAVLVREAQFMLATYESSITDIRDRLSKGRQSDVVVPASDPVVTP